MNGNSADNLVKIGLTEFFRKGRKHLREKVLLNETIAIVKHKTPVAIVVNFDEYRELVNELHEYRSQFKKAEESNAGLSYEATGQRYSNH